jgi:predicted O-methyltransferase YrrM
VYSQPQLAIKFLKYFLTASGSKGHGMHSPFVFDFITKVLNDKTVYSGYGKVESLRKQLLNNHTVLQSEDFGAGSSIHKSNRRSISSIVKNASKPPKYAQLLFRMVRYYQPSTILELGTSLGITTYYLSLAKPDAALITMEGSGEIARTARQNFKALELGKPEIIEGNFDSTLPSVISRLSSADFAFIDGNHRREPAERYFHLLLEKINNNSILVFDDIHWSREMEEAWKNILSHPSVRCSIDLFFLGIVFFRQELREKQHFTIRF